MKLQKEFLKHIKARDEKELRDGIRDIITRYGRPTSQGGYSADFLTDQMYIYFYVMFGEFRKEYQELKKELEEQK